MKLIRMWLVPIFFFCFAAPVFAEGEAPATVQSGKTVTLNMSLTVDGKEMMNTESEGQKPVEYVHGEHQIVPGLEKELEGLKVGDQKDMVVAAEEGFGPVHEEAFVEYPKTQLPEGKEMQIGMGLELISPEGGRMPALVSEIKDEVVVLNLNHPLAGKELHFHVKVLDIK